VEPDAAPPPPGLQEDDRRQVLGQRPVSRAAEKIVVDGSRVALEEDAERARLTLYRAPPELRIGRCPIDR
jgi:hypothetical protein